MLDGIGRSLPERVVGWLEPLLSPAVLTGLGIMSLVTFAASLFGIPYFLTRLPADYFTRRESNSLGLSPRPRGPGERLLTVLKNLLALVLLLSGILMLVLPGQALLTILVALLLLDFPGKRRFERWVLGRPRVLRTINALRARAGKPPFNARASWIPPSRRDSGSDGP